jgi:hypothetical protein
MASRKKSPLLSKSEPIFDDGKVDTDKWFYPVIDGERKGMGLVPRDLKESPPSMFSAPPSDMKLIPRSEWSARCKEQIEQKSRLSDLKNFDALDQNGQGYCWYYSTTSCVMMLRAVMNEPMVRLSAHAGAYIIKNGRDEGGWCGLSAERQKSHGTPSVQFWPEKSMNGRQYDKPETWEDAAKHKVTEDWIDLTRNVYDRNLTFDQLASCLLNDIPCAVDFSFWAHSVCALDLVEVESGSFGIRILNSWSKNWGEAGMGILRGGKERPDGAVALRVTGASNA